MTNNCRQSHDVAAPDPDHSRLHRPAHVPHLLPHTLLLQESQRIPGPEGLGNGKRSFVVLLSFTLLVSFRSTIESPVRTLGKSSVQ